MIFVLFGTAEPIFRGPFAVSFREATQLFLQLLVFLTILAMLPLAVRPGRNFGGWKVGPTMLK